MSVIERARYFAQYGLCDRRRCAEPVTGKVRDGAHQALGRYCSKHGGEIIARAEKLGRKEPKAAV